MSDDLPETTDVGTLGEMELEVAKRFKGDWVQFLKAVSNPAEVLHFVLAEHFKLDQEKFEAWAANKNFPEGWISRFYTTLTPEGELKDEGRYKEKDEDDDEPPDPKTVN